MKIYRLSKNAVYKFIYANKYKSLAFCVLTPKQDVWINFTQKSNISRMCDTSSKLIIDQVMRCHVDIKSFSLCLLFKISGTFSVLQSALFIFKLLFPMYFRYN